MRLNKSNNKQLKTKSLIFDLNASNKQRNGILYMAAVMIILVLLATLVNDVIYKYPGNNYFPSDCRYNALTILLIYIGCILQYGRDSKPARMMQESFCFFLVMLLLALATNAAQYTPFPTIDIHILAIEEAFHIHLNAIIHWTSTHSRLQAFLEFVYDSLSYQLCYIPLLFIATQRFKSLYEYYFLLIVSALIGFTFYYFFPTTAPASVIHGDFFNATQRATGLKFQQIHHHIAPYTLEGGLVALPSFHVIWAWFCLYLLRCWSVFFLLLLPFNIVLMSACVLLGWHYTIDLFGSLIVILISHGLYYLCVTRTLNAIQAPACSAASNNLLESPSNVH